MAAWITFAAVGDHAGSAEGPYARLEMLVEPFRESDPGPHVLAAIDAAQAAGLDVEMDALATIVSGPIDDLAGATAAIIRTAFDHGATAIQLHVQTSAPDAQGTSP